MSKKLTLDEVNQRIKCFGHNIELLDEYQGSRVKVRFKCLDCGYEWKVLPGHILNGSGCPQCSHLKSNKNKQISKEEFLKTIVPTIEIIGDYNGYKNDVHCRCKTCGYEWNVKALYLKNAKACPRCSNRLGLTNESLLEIINENSPTILVLEDNIVNKEHLHCKCKVCRYEWNPHVVALRRGQECPKCTAKRTAQSLTKTYDQFVKEANDIHLNKYDYSKVEYINSRTKVCIICPEHGEFWLLPGHHISGNGCPICNSSKGERDVEAFLKLHKIKYISLYEIICPINISGIAKIDFFLPDLNIAIEYNGELHYTSKKFTGGVLLFKKQLQRDEFVRNYCKENNIKLIEIPFYQNTREKVFNELSAYVEVDNNGDYTTGLIRE